MKHPHYAVWMGDHWLPTLHYARMAESTFTSGEAYKLAVLEEKEKEKRTARRTKEQNDLMWALLSEIANQVQHKGQRYSADQWKVLLMDVCGHEIQLLPSLVEGKGIVPYGGRSSHMTVAQMAELIEFIRYWGTEHGVKFADMEGITWQR